MISIFALLLLAAAPLVLSEAQYPVVGENTLDPVTYYYVKSKTALGTPIVSVVSAVLKKKTLDTGSKTTTTTQQYCRSMGMPCDDAGHILAHRLGGSGSDPVNIFPQNATLNRGEFRMFEDFIYNCISNSAMASAHAQLDWTFTYGNKDYPMRPSKVRYSVQFFPEEDDCKMTTKTFLNEADECQEDQKKNE